MNTLVKRFGDYHVNLVREYVDDEYQEHIENRSNTVVVNTLPYTLYGMGAILAWSIPGSRALLSLLVFVPLLVGIYLGNGWMKNYAPRPKPIVPKWMLIIVIPLVTTQGLGIVYNTMIRSAEPSFSVTPVLIAGTVAGALLGGWLGKIGTTQKMNKDRTSDLTRLESELED